MMTVRGFLARASANESLNFFVTNRLPRRLATRFMGWFSRIEQAQVRDLSIAIWRMFCDVDLSDARKASFTSLHDCFVRELKNGARPFDSDPAILASPCDAIVGACGRIDGGRLLQIKGYSYRMKELLGDAGHAALYRGGCYATLRLTAGMYHHFHAPDDVEVEAVDYFAGDTWNVNPAALKRVDRLYCRNERATIRMRTRAGGHPLTLVPVAAILVAGLRLPFAGAGSLRAGGTRTIPVRAGFAKGAHMGWFEHGSTIILVAPAGFILHETISEGTRIKAGLPLLRRDV